MSRTFSIAALTLALLTASPPSALGANPGPQGPTPGLDVPQPSPTKADCIASFREELRWCGNQFADDDILREACASGALMALEDCLASV